MGKNTLNSRMAPSVAGSPIHNSAMTGAPKYNPQDNAPLQVRQ